MINEPSVIAPSDLSNATTHDLRAELARSLEITATHLVYLAAIWRELEARGEDLSDLRSGMGVYLPMIAAGHLAAEAVVRFAGNRSLLRNIAQLPIEKQRELANDATVTVLVSDGAELNERQMPLHRLTFRLMSQVFGGGHIRSTAEQKAHLKPKKKDAPVLRRTRQGSLVIGHTKVEPAQIVDQLGKIFEAEPDVERDKQVVIYLSDAEHRALRISAAKADKSMTRLIADALRSLGLLSEQ